MTPSVDPREFRRAEQTTDTGRLVRFLREFSSSSGVRAMNDHVQQMLELRPGHQVLDVGCGTGDEVRRLASLVGPAGRVVGVDTQGMVAAAREGGVPDNAEFVAADAHALPFETSSFDRYRAYRVYMHLAETSTAVGEAVRVVRPGGVVVVSEPDWATLALDADDVQLTSAVIKTIQDAMEQPWIGRQLARLFREAGLENVQIAPQFGLFPTFELAYDALLKDATDKLTRSGDFESTRITSWLQGLANRAASGDFFFGGLTVLARGYKPQRRTVRSLATRLRSARGSGN
jgi:ubiquinone/menaquinone biosynthesis C-methylase UbiE